VLLKFPGYQVWSWRYCVSTWRGWWCVLCFDQRLSTGPSC